MTNPYYSAPATPVDFTVAKSIQIRQQWQAIEAAFDKLAGRITFLIAGGTANALTVTMDFPPEEYAEGLMFNAKIATTNTGAATMNVNGLGAVAILGRDGSPLGAGDLVEDSVETFFYVEDAFRIRAVEGAQGPQGPVGTVEEAPIDGTIYARQDADWVPVPEGEPGEDGASAYDIAVDNGFVGTEAEWLDSLVGEQGPQGNVGPQGAQGPQGATGPAGANGADGAGGSWNDLGSKPENLTDFAALVGAADKLAYFTGANSQALTNLTAFGRALLASNDLAALAGAAGVVGVQEVSLTSPGWIRFNVGAGQVLTIMWGTAVAALGGYTTVVYPDGGFTHFSVALCSSPERLSHDARQNPPGVVSASTASFSIFSSADMDKTVQWIAIGR